MNVGRMPGRRPWLAVVLLFPAALATFVTIALAASPRQVTVRVTTWNIAAGHGDLSKTIAFLRDQAPDVAALQEVDVHWHERSRFADQAAELGHALGLAVRFAPIYHLPADDGGPPREFGVAILSRHPITAFTNHPLPRLSTQSPMTDPELMPGFAEVRVRIDGTDLRVFTTHLDYRSDPRVRALQVASTLERLGHANVPTVLMGDLNAPPDAPEIAPLFRRLRDAWSDRLEAGFTYPAANPARRIDYILTSEGIGAQHVRVIPTDASDHRAVSADLTIVR